MTIDLTIEVFEVIQWLMLIIGWIWLWMSSSHDEEELRKLRIRIEKLERPDLPETVIDPDDPYRYGV